MKAVSEYKRLVSCLSVVFLTFALTLVSSDATAGPGRSIAKLLFKSGWTEVKSDYYMDKAKAQNLPSAAARDEARDDALEEWGDGQEEVEEQFEARMDLNLRLGQARYNPVINPADFLSPAQIVANPNPYMPLIPGTIYTYEGVTAEGTETIVVEVTADTREILGVTCMVVRDTAFLGGEMIEDTWDWFTQDVTGNVWYFGEETFEYENDRAVSMDGAWEAGYDGAQPGIVMEATPLVGDLYRQEYYIGEAEDVAEVLSLNESVVVPWGPYNNCLMTGDFTPIEPDALEFKYYAPGVGLVLEVDADTLDRVELINLVTP